jgi:hypothetical protein
MSAINIAKISWSSFFAMRINGAAPMQWMFSSASEASSGSLSDERSEQFAVSSSGSGSDSCVGSRNY